MTVEESEDLDLKGLAADVHDGLVLDNVNSWNQLRRWRAVLQARNAKSKGGKSATNIHAYVQYLYAMPVVATVDMDAPDSHLVEEGHPNASRWRLRNLVVLSLSPGETFYTKPPTPPPSTPQHLFFVCGDAEEAPSFGVLIPAQFASAWGECAIVFLAGRKNVQCSA